MPYTPHRLNLHSVGRRLCELILVQYSSVGCFADRIGVSRRTLYRITCERGVPTLFTLVKICGQLDCTLDFLLGLSCPESESAEAWETVLLNVREFGRTWSKKKRLLLAKAILDRLTPEEKKTLNFLVSGEKSRTKTL